MGIYLGIFGVLSILSLASHVKEFKRWKLFFVLLATILLIVIAGMRGPYVTNDYENYAKSFENVPSLGSWVIGDYTYTFEETWMEPAYVAYGAFIKIFTDNCVWMFLGVAFLSVGIASFNYYRYSRYVFLTLLLFFVHTYLHRDMTQIRAAIAAAIGLFLVKQISDREHKKVIWTIALAGAFHMASLSFIFVYLLSFIRVTRWRATAAVTLGVIFGSVGISFTIMKFLPNLGYITTKIEGYAASQYVDTVHLFDITNVKNLLLSMMMIVFWDRLKERVPYFDTMAIFMLAATFWRTAFSDFGIIAARIATFFGIVEVLLLPAFVLLFKQKYIITIIIVGYAFATLFLHMRTLRPYYFANLFF